MIINKTSFDGLYEIESKIFEDKRGIFAKKFNFDIFLDNGINFNTKEYFYSKSKKNVIRGMHFQIPPFDHGKIISVTDGEILDVLVDIRKDSPTYLQFYSVVLSERNSKSICVDSGFAHGFLTLSESATVEYLTTSTYNSQADSGIRWDSFGFEWPCDNPIISERDFNFSWENIDKYNLW